MIPVDNSLTQETIPITLTSISPAAGLNPNGDGVLTISGSDFPRSLDDGS